MSAFGRWMYGPWFWPPANAVHGPIANPYYDPNCDPNVTEFCEPELIPARRTSRWGWRPSTTPQCQRDGLPGGDAGSPVVPLADLETRRTTASGTCSGTWRTRRAPRFALKAAEVAAAQTDPVVFPTPDTTSARSGPNWIQIGTRAGSSLPRSSSPTSRSPGSPTRPASTSGNVDQHSLLARSGGEGRYVQFWWTVSRFGGSEP